MKIILYITSIVLLLSAAGCKKNTDIFTYDKEKSSIYFGYTFPALRDEINTVKGIDSINFSFTSVDVTLDRHVIKVPVHVAGLSSAVDRAFKYSIVSEGTTMDANNFKILRNTVGQGKFQDSLEVEILKTVDLKEKEKNITIRLEENENFKSGYVNNQSIKIKVSNILPIPSWWKTWVSVFGPYSQEKYQVWQQIYHERADGYLGYRYNYKNMPATANKSFYPSTFVFIQQLKQYFVDNVVYEGGDPKNPRISIPFQF